MTEEQTPQEPEHHDPDAERSVEFGTHPLSIISVVSGIASMVTVGSCCIAPTLAPWLQGLCGVIAAGAATLTLVRIHRGKYDRSSNLAQARIGLVLGILGIVCAVIWFFVIDLYGAGLGMTPTGGGGLGQ